MIVHGNDGKPIKARNRTQQEMVKAFRFIMEHYRENPEKIKDFICGNIRYIRARMLGYVKRNIELFY